jgi:hypothetical protein
MFVNFAATRLHRRVAMLAMTLGLGLPAGNVSADAVKPTINLAFYTDLGEGGKRDNNQKILLFIVNEGLLDGVLTVQQAYREIGASPRICPRSPDEFNTAGPFFGAIAAELKANAKRYDPPEKVDMGEVTLFALQRSFPCK